MILRCITRPTDPFRLFLLLLIMRYKGLSTCIHENFTGGHGWSPHAWMQWCSHGRGWGLLQLIRPAAGQGSVSQAHLGVSATSDSQIRARPGGEYTEMASARKTLCRHSPCLTNEGSNESQVFDSLIDTGNLLLFLLNPTTSSKCSNSLDHGRGCRTPPSNKSSF